jgi:parallel beta-helix repeat protein
MGVIFASSFMQPEDASGLPLAGAELYFYEAGTTTPTTVYQDAGETTPHANPVVASADGIFPPIYVVAAAYKTVLKTAAGVTVQTVDNISLLAPSNSVGTDAISADLALTMAPVVYSRTAMKSLDTARYNAANLIDAKRSGPFRLLAVSSLGEYDLLVRSADTTEGIFVNSTHDTAYTWVRAEWLVHKNIRDPMWFGAVGEAYFRGDGGITNPGLDEVWYSDPSFLVPAVSDSAAIQAAVDSIPTHFADGVTQLPHHRAGHTLKFRSGGYRLTDVITLGVRAMVVKGNGVAASDGTILIQTTGNANHFDGSYIYGFYGLVFQGLGNGVGTGNALNLAYSGTSLFSARLRDLYFVQLGNACIKLGTAGAQEPHIQGCTLEVTPYGLYAEEVKEALIGGNNFYGLSKAGIFIKKSEQNTLTGNNFELCAHGIGSGQTGFGAVVINATEPGTALARDTVISSNTFYSNNIDVALVGAVGTPSANTGPMGFTIIGNRSQFANAQSIYVNGPACVFILGHKVFDANNANYANIAAIDINNSIDSHVDHCENWTPAANKVHWGLRSSANTNLRLGMSNRFTGQTADTSISSWSNLDFDRLPVITTANRPGASAARSGTAYIEDTGGTPRIVIHIGAARWYVALTASF